MADYPVSKQLSASLCGFSAMRRASRAVTRSYELVLRPTGLKVTQFTILRLLDYSGEAPQWKIANELCASVDTLTRRLSALRKTGLIEMRKGPHRGEHLYRLTKQGANRLRQAEPYWERAQQRLKMTLGECRWEELMNLLPSVVEAARLAPSIKLPNSRPFRGSRAAIPPKG